MGFFVRFKPNFQYRGVSDVISSNGIPVYAVRTGLLSCSIR